MERLTHSIAAIAVFCLGTTSFGLCTPSGPPPYTLTPPEYWYWNTSTCSYQEINGQSPVIIDTKGIGFQFTDPTKGDYVTFDLKGDGSYKKFSWPKQGSGNAWLVLDRDGDGVIKNGTELFGNFTPHSDGGVPNYPKPNGFLALDWYDQPQQGGDGNAIIDKRDAIWPKLKLWIDTHCYKTPDTPCQSLPQELYTLESEGVTSISMVWNTVSTMPAGTPAATKNGWTVYGPMGGPTDLVGNEYVFYTLLNPDAEKTPRDEKGQVCCDLHQKSHDGRWAIDVYLNYIQYHLPAAGRDDHSIY